MLPYEKLSDADKERNRQPAREFRAKLAELGVQVARSAPGQAAGGVRPELSDTLISAEHDRWLRERLQQGWEWAATSDDDRRQHRSVASFLVLEKDDQVLDQEIVETLLGELERSGYRLIELSGDSSGA
jgi:hypothetical protein